jgi:hypothetical protein
MPKKTKADQRRRTKLVPLDHGVFGVFKDGKPRRIEVRLLPKLRRLFGDRLVVGFVQGFVAAERLDALGHLFLLNGGGTRKGSLAFLRNVRTLRWMQLGALYEAAAALKTIGGGGVAGIVGKDFAAWVALAAMKDRWTKDDLLKRIRHDMAHHFGEEDFVRKGLDNLGSRRVVFFETDSAGEVVNSSYPVVLDVQLAALAAEQTTFIALVERAFRDHLAFSDNLQRLFWEVLRVKGVRIPADS